MKKISLLSLFISIFFNAQQAPALQVHDTRNINNPPSSYQSEFRAEFKLRDVMGVPGEGSSSVNLTLAPWVDASGGSNHQLNFNDGGFFFRSGMPNGNWNAWKNIWHSGNLNNSSSDFTAKDLHAYGFLKVTDYSPLLYLDRNTSSGGYIQGVQTRLQDGTNNWFFGNFHADSFIINAGGYDSARLFTLSRSGNASLQGKFEAKEVKVTTTPTADFVFEENYNLPKLEDVEKHIKEKKHLPEIASAKEMEKEGVNLGEFQIKLLQKIEELTLYTIQLNKQLKEQAEKINQLEKQISQGK